MHNKFIRFFSLDGDKVSLEQLLEARENRVLLQQQCLQQYGQTLLSVTLLAVGEVKKNALLDYVFEKALSSLSILFQQLNIQPTAEFIRPFNTGHEALFVLPIDAKQLKKLTIELEDSSALARLWDIDVIDSRGQLLSRTEFNIPPRPCLICSENAKSCARSRKHTLNEIYTEIQRRARTFYLAENISESVYQALLKEVYLTPKPGLVDRSNNGAHNDMNVRTFERSAVALRPFFTQFVLKGIATANLPVKQILTQIRPLGLQAEKAMFQATNNVNTHKGAIFAFGLVCTAIGRLFEQKTDINHTNICQLVAQFAQGLTTELQHYSANQPLTAGIMLYREYGLTGARGEAESGFGTIHPVLAEYTNQKIENDEIWLRILLKIIAKNNDTNVVHRGGINALYWVQNEAKRLLNDEDFNLKNLHSFDNACIHKNISCGGSADLLALTIFLLNL
ncbi:2-(5'-triphosphoribosyl)-3'-dephospho CoA synthase [Mannheimia granulomatis]|uniref:Probable 2-(5''-triphosphoribosyl)-3'-dephosphocoenzyme-A synthase n=1 Tax=Mannheimia granulomatis TaxID=85402 RepID=A0A6G8JL71_9PAST|nr:triphosphoribosyl-dephospho-CoA synthase CitG [Mannheimia granulomatis]QIM67723.1 2-(5'-triphosphoribosyl)-3'-dephospho CoA synthase [Mannheimia granulomatis]